MKANFEITIIFSDNGTLKFYAYSFNYDGMELKSIATGEEIEGYSKNKGVYVRDVYGEDGQILIHKLMPTKELHHGIKGFSVNRITEEEGSDK